MIFCRVKQTFICLVDIWAITQLLTKGHWMIFIPASHQVDLDRWVFIFHILSFVILFAGFLHYFCLLSLPMCNWDYVRLLVFFLSGYFVMNDMPNLILWACNWWNLDQGRSQDLDMRGARKIIIVWETQHKNIVPKVELIWLYCNICLVIYKKATFLPVAYQQD